MGNSTSNLTSNQRITYNSRPASVGSLLRDVDNNISCPEGKNLHEVKISYGTIDSTSKQSFGPNTIGSSMHNEKVTHQRWVRSEASMNYYEKMALTQLGLPMNANVDDIKKKYKFLAYHNHPDRGGNVETFNLIQESYTFLMTRRTSIESIKINQPVVKQEYNELEDSKRENIHLGNGKNFNINTFNKVFSEHRLENPNDKGYSDIMCASKPKERSEPTITKLTGDLHEKFKEKHTGAMIIYKEPECLISGTQFNNCVELGQDDISDFTGASDQQLVFTDYRVAYDDNKKYINPDNVSIKEKNLEQIKMERSNTNYTMTEKEKRTQYEREQKRIQDEAERINRLKEHDKLHEEHFNKINRLMIRNQK